MCVQCIVRAVHFLKENYINLNMVNHNFKMTELLIAVLAVLTFERCPVIVYLFEW